MVVLGIPQLSKLRSETLKLPFGVVVLDMLLDGGQIDGSLDDEKY